MDKDHVTRHWYCKPEIVVYVGSPTRMPKAKRVDFPALDPVDFALAFICFQAKSIRYRRGTGVPLPALPPSSQYFFVDTMFDMYHDKRKEKGYNKGHWSSGFVRLALVEFRRSDPPQFARGMDLVVVDKWHREIKKIFREMGCLEEQMRFLISKDDEFIRQQVVLPHLGINGAKVPNKVFLKTCQPMQNFAHHSHMISAVCKSIQQGSSHSEIYLMFYPPDRWQSPWDVLGADILEAFQHLYETYRQFRELCKQMKTHISRIMLLLLGQFKAMCPLPNTFEAFDAIAFGCRNWTRSLEYEACTKHNLSSLLRSVQ
ncbi:hypothetical protein CR513_44614, partial [Mucuna pruriens]